MRIRFRNHYAESFRHVDASLGHLSASINSLSQRIKWLEEDVQRLEIVAANRNQQEHEEPVTDQYGLTNDDWDPSR